MIVASLAIASPAFARETVRPVSFKPGATAGVARGVIRGDDDVTHTLALAQGQVLQLLLKASNRSCYFNVYEPGQAEAVHIGSVAGNEFGQNPTKAGTYRLQVYLMRNAARRGETCRYSLSIEAAGRPGGVSAGVSDQAMKDACRASATPMYGVAGRRIRLGAVARQTGGFRIDGIVDKGAEGLKKLRCIFTAERTLDRIMALTPDGE
jgi:hypothetical protein